MAQHLYAKKSHVMVLPEQVPDKSRAQVASGALDWPVYACITEVARARRGRKVLTFTTRPADGSPETSFTMLKDECIFAYASAQEARSNIGALLRRFVIFRLHGSATAGQVVAVRWSNKSLTVANAGGTYDVGADEVQQCHPIGASALWGMEVELGDRAMATRRFTATALLLETMRSRVEDPVNGSRKFEVVFRGTAADAMPTADTRLEIRAPATGARTSLSVQHVVDFFFFAVEGRVRPGDVAVGETFWRDPRYAEAVGGEDREEGERHDEEEVPVVVTIRRRVDVVRPPQLEPNIGAAPRPEGEFWAQGHAIPPPGLDEGGPPAGAAHHHGFVAPCAHLPVHGAPQSRYWLAGSALAAAAAPYANPAGPPSSHWTPGQASYSLTGLRQPPGPAHLPVAAGTIQVPDAAAAAAIARQRVQAAEDARNKRQRMDLELNPTASGVHYITASTRTAGWSLLKYMDKIRTDLTLPFYKHPEVLRALYSFDFGSGRLSLAHLQRRTQAQIDTWTHAHMDLTGAKPSGRTTPVHALSPDALVGALDTLAIYTESYCAPVVQQFVAKAGCLLRHMVREGQVTAHTGYVARWLDWAFACFRMDMAHDVESDAAILTHWSSHENLSSSSPMLASLAHTARNDCIRQLMDSQAAAQRSRDARQGTGGSHDAAKRRSSRAAPRISATPIRGAAATRASRPFFP